jgi:hypothetical protein
VLPAERAHALLNGARIAPHDLRAAMREHGLRDLGRLAPCDLNPDGRMSDPASVAAAHDRAGDGGAVSHVEIDPASAAASSSITTRSGA